MLIDAKIGSTSLVGIGNPDKKDYPLDFGNYFSFLINRKGYECGLLIRCINMWAENLEYLIDEGYLPYGKINVDLYSIDNKTWAIVNDDRVPEGFINDSFYYVGYYQPPERLTNFFYEYYGCKTRGS